MRKYKGKRVDNGEWVHGYLIGDDVIVGDIVDFTDEYFNTEFWYKVDPKTVGQYIGKTDGSGKEIYEGDYEVDHVGVYFIAKYVNGELGMIVWEPEYGAYFDDCVDWDDFAIHGNRWDNPDLLEGEKI
ncbi:YopX family protein [Paenibacillus lactis]|uniref:YopX family protein n=1 Tax=Paenibacillus lactis TaxID=228574 RepID=UPI003D753B82